MALVIIEHGLDLAEMRPQDHDIAFLKGPALYDQRGQSTFTGAQVRFDHDTSRLLVWIRAELEHFRFKKDHIQKIIDTLSGHGGHRDHNGLPAPIF